MYAFFTHLQKEFRRIISTKVHIARELHFAYVSLNGKNRKSIKDEFYNVYRHDFDNNSDIDIINGKRQFQHIVALKSATTTSVRQKQEICQGFGKSKRDDTGKRELAEGNIEEKL